MKRRHQSVFGLSAVIIFASIAAAGDGPSAAESADVDRLIKLMDSPDEATRVAADQSVIDLPVREFSLTKAAADRKDFPPSTTARLRAIVARAEPFLKQRGQAQADADDARAWLISIYHADYLQNAQGPPVWDGDVGDAFELAGRKDPGVRAEELDRSRQILRRLDSAIAAGCREAAVFALKATVLADLDEDPMVVAKWYDKAAASFGNNSDQTKVVVDFKLLRAAQAGFNGGLKPNWKLVCSRYEEAQRITIKVIADQYTPKVVALDLAHEEWDLGWAFGADQKTVFDMVNGPLDKRWHMDPAVLTFVGQFLTQWGWKARGDGPWADVAEPTWKVVNARLDKATVYLAASYKKDPTLAATSMWMMDVTCCRHNDADERDKWFNRAIEADPDYYLPYRARLSFLEPKWDGSEKQMLEFAHDCLGDGNWRAKIPFILIEAHQDLAALSDDPAEYWKKPDVAADLEKVYRGYLLRYPEDDRVRSAHAFHAATAGDFKTADAEFKRVGDRLDVKPFGGKGQADQLRKATSEAVENDRHGKRQV